MLETSGYAFVVSFYLAIRLRVICINRDATDPKDGAYVSKELCYKLCPVFSQNPFWDTISKGPAVQKTGRGNGFSFAIHLYRECEIRTSIFDDHNEALVRLIVGQLAKNGRRYEFERAVSREKTEVLLRFSKSTAGLQTELKVMVGIQDVVGH